DFSCISCRSIHHIFLRTILFMIVRIIVITYFFNKIQRQTFLVIIKMLPTAIAPIIYLLFMIDIFQTPTTIPYSAPMVRISVNSIICKKITAAVFAYIVRFYKTNWLFRFFKNSKRIFKEVKSIVHVNMNKVNEEIV